MATTSPASRSTSAPAWRLSAPGEVLVTGTVRDPVAGAGIASEDCGTQALRGVPGTWPVLAVRG